MIPVYLTTLLVGALSAVLPLTPVEPYLVGVITTTAVNPILCGLAAALGQTAGKSALFFSARGVLRSAVLRRRRDRAKPGGRFGARLLETLDRPRWSVPVVFLSAVSGLPPLLAVSVYAARTRISGKAFVLACLLGRSIRFVLIAEAPRLVGHG
ncbi:hypothetical protein [Cryptosporangium sp. NPDC051539]|uniref:hypothetical protein n=1 Tax=Cryptosporangium sp. NPDC051539 TaxID=3363962 RepID=UPI0037B83492